MTTVTTKKFFVATVLTVYGIETIYLLGIPLLLLFPLQQYLPFTVLKPAGAVLLAPYITLVATVLTVYGIETPILRLV